MKQEMQDEVHQEQEQHCWLKPVVKSSLMQELMTQPVTSDTLPRTSLTIKQVAAEKQECWKRMFSLFLHAAAVQQQPVFSKHFNQLQFYFIFREQFILTG